MSDYTDQSEARVRRLHWDGGLSYDWSTAPLVPQTPLRMRWLGGYRREDVELLLMECRLLAQEAEFRIDSLRERERKLEEEVSALRRELAASQARTEASQQLLAQADKLLWNVHELIADARASTAEVPGGAALAEPQHAAVEVSEEAVAQESAWETELAGPAAARSGVGNH